MKFRTNISQTKKGEHYLRGRKLTALIQKHTFVDIIFLLWRGDLPQVRERRLLDAVLVAAVENGIAAPSLYVPRIVTSVGNSMPAALAAGMLAIGEIHGGAVEAAAQLLSSSQSPKKIVQESRAQIKFLPGYGHKIYKERDPRAHSLYQQMKKLKFPGKYFRKAFAIEKELQRMKKKTLPLNIDGAIAAAILELGFPPELGKAFFSLARLVGMTAHIAEEQSQHNSYYRLEESDISSPLA